MTIRHLGGLMLARIDGKSPAEYIRDEPTRQRVRRIRENHSERRSREHWRKSSGWRIRRVEGLAGEFRVPTIFNGFEPARLRENYFAAHSPHPSP